MTFESSIYTDVRAQEAVDGVDGFNFQSVSGGLDGTDQSVIREVMLHQISTQWPIDREERDHPPTAAFMTRNDRFYFSRGMSTGTTENGRRGNQLTQAVVTPSADDIRPYRPAQILGAVNWNLVKAGSTTCEPWFAPLELSSGFESDALLIWLRSDTWAQQVLPAYLTMLEEASGEKPRKIVLVHQDLHVILRWMALGTLLMNGQDAICLELRAFVSDPYQTSAQLVGMHPDLMRGSASGAYTINIADRTISDIQVSESALAVRNWALLLDSFDALEVIDIAQRWMPAIGVRYGAAGAEVVTGTRVARVGREEWDLGVSIIEGLAGNGLRNDLELYLDELAEAVSTYRLHSEDDFVRAARATRYAANTGIPGLTEALLTPTLESLAAAPEFALVWVREMEPAGWVWPSLDGPEAIFQNLAEVLHGAPDAALGPLLILVKPLGTLLSEVDLRSVLRRAAAYVRMNVGLARQVDGWFGAAPVRELLRAQLSEELASAGPQRTRTFEELQAGHWDFLDPTGEPMTRSSIPFINWLNAARVAREEVDGREWRLRSMATKPGQDSWSIVLGDAELPQHIGVWTAWLETVGANPEMQHHVVWQIRNIIGRPPNEAKAKEVQRWSPLIRVLVECYPESPSYKSLARDFHSFLESIPSFKDRASSFGESMKGLFSGRSKEQ